MGNCCSIKKHPFVGQFIILSNFWGVVHNGVGVSCTCSVFIVALLNDGYAWL